MKVCTDCTLGLDAQGGSLSWLAGFAGNWLRAQLGLPTGAWTHGLNFLTPWLLQGSWTSYPVTQGYQSMCPMAQEKLHCPLWCSLRSHAAAPFLHCTICKWVRSLCQFMRVGYRSRFWWKECPKFVNIKLPQMTS